MEERANFKFFNLLPNMATSTAVLNFTAECGASFKSLHVLFYVCVPKRDG
jgi:hypothetical protein